MTKYKKLRATIQREKAKSKQEGILIGENNYIDLLTKQGRNHQKQIDILLKEHAQELIELNKNHRKELALFEKEYQIKNTALDKKLKRIDSLVREHENKVVNIRKLAASTHELNCKAKEKLYQNNKELAGVTDDEKSLEAIETNLDLSLKKTTLAKGLSE